MNLSKKIAFLIVFSLTNYFAFAQSIEEIKKLQDEYSKVLELQSMQKPDEIENAEKTASSTALPNKLIYSRKDIESLLINTEKLLKQLEFLKDSTSKMPFVGYEIFTQRDTIPFWQNLPISPNYVLGPGDEIIISLWGEVDLYNSETINRDGQVYIENIGILNLGDKTIGDAKKYVLSKYSPIYSTLLGNNPKSFVDITLGDLKSVNVHFVGFVNIPGVHLVHPFSNIITGLMQAGGISEDGTLRDIHLIRGGKKIGNIDIYNYIFRGKSLNDLRLMNQDIIYVPPRKSTIPLTGKIKKPGYYEIIKDESLDDLFGVAGGKENSASASIFLYRDNNNSNSAHLVNPNQLSDFIILDGDSIHVPERVKIDKFVRIEGQVKNPGEYPFQENMNIKDLIDATMTLNDTDFMKTVDLSKIILNRKNPSGENPLRIIIDIKQNSFPLNNGDYITIPRKNQFYPIESVIITGEVKNPGIYPVNNLTTLDKVLELSGGYSDFALINGIEIIRDSLKIAWDDNNFILNDGDSLNVIKKSGLVLVDGQVNAPGYVNYRKGDSVKKYIDKAGGFSSFAETRDIFIIYPNGVAKPYRRFFSPKVYEGSKIIVNQRNFTGSSKGPTGWEAFSIVSSQAGSVATTLLTLMILLNQSTSSSGS
tara:strand:- start:17754 stop:19700 length:1947 start_codon:yes stop_codon:yes gene_type:complete